jgi:hypothetical protein
MKAATERLVKRLFLQLHNKKKIKKMQALVTNIHPKVARAFLRAYAAYLKRAVKT